MIVEDIRICGFLNPVGYLLENPVLSWKVRDAQGENQTHAKVIISMDEEQEHVVIQTEGMLSNVETVLDFNMSPRTRYFVHVEVTDEQGDIGLGKSYFETGKMDEPFTGKWIGPSKDVHAVISSRFSMMESVNPRLYISGVGVYEAYLNGERLGDEYLSPGFSDYEKEIQVQTHELNGKLLKENNLEIYLGNGWYKGRFGLDNETNIWGDQMAALFEIRDGDKLIHVSDENAKGYLSDVQSSGIYDGEVHVSRAEKETVQLMEMSVSGKPVDQFGEPIRVVKRLQFERILKTPKGETVLDFGQNMAGILEVKDSLPQGTTVQFHFGEVLQQNSFYNDNYRTAAKPFVFESYGDGRTVHPRHTFFGFRYVKIEGWQGEIGIDDITALVLSSDLEETGSIRTSNEGLNRLFENAMWSQRGNFIELPTDCPQRDERLGWTGDAQVFAGTASFNMNTRIFFRKYIRHLRYAQLSLEGGIPNYVPDIGGLKGVASIWGDAGSIIPYTMYRYFGSAAELAQYYQVMRDWAEYLITRDKNDGDKGLILSGQQFGDWLALDGSTQNSFKGGTDDYYLASAYYYHTLRLVEEAAGSLGKYDDEQRYNHKAEKVKEAILQEYFSETGRLAVDTQTGYIVALKFGLYRNLEKLKVQFREKLKKDMYEIRAGFVGAPQIFMVMADNGMKEEALKMLLSESYPGWLHCISLGATTIWERWNSLDSDGLVSPTGMNSFNHYAYGAVVEYMYRKLAGFEETEPGFGKVRIYPTISGYLPELSMSYESVHGRYVLNYEISIDGRVSVCVEVPFGCEAEVILPGWKEGSRILKKGIHKISYKPEHHPRKIFTLESKIRDFAISEQAMESMKKHMPTGFYMLQNNEKELTSLSLGEFMNLFFLGVNPEQGNAFYEEVKDLVI